MSTIGGYGNISNTTGARALSQTAQLQQAEYARVAQAFAETMQTPQAQIMVWLGNAMPELAGVMAQALAGMVMQRASQLPLNMPNNGGVQATPARPQAPPPPRYNDAGAGRAIEHLKTKPQPYSGKDMEKAITNATKDLDGQAAGKEYKDLKKFATENWDKMSPNAREKFRTYEKYAQAAQAKGKTGIPQGEYNKMLKEMHGAGYKDAGAAKQIEGLKGKPAPISGDDMQNAIVNGTKDLDGQAAGKEYSDFKKYATQNWDKMSPEAQAKFKTYEKYAKAAQAKGQTGIPKGEYDKMVKEMKVAGYQDKGAGAAIEDLKSKPKPTSGADMEKAITNGTKDLDGQAAGKEYADLKKYATENWNTMSPDAKEKFRTYEKYAQAAQAKGQTGIAQGEYNKMLKEMHTAGYKDAGAANQIEGLKGKPAPISGDDMQSAILNGTKDLDGQAAGKEYADFKKYATENWDKMSPEAQAKFQTYEKYAQAAQAKGQSGISQTEYAKMTSEMKLAGYADKSAGAAVEHLKTRPQPVSGQDMEKCIVDATKDLDNNAAGGEYKDLKNYATQNWSKMSPEAQAKFNTYEKYALAAQAKGQTGIPMNEYNKMLGEMKTAGYNDPTAGAAIEGLKSGPQPVSGAAMQNAIINGTKDLDAQAAGKEFADFSKYAKENWSSMTPDAKAKFHVYEKYAHAAQAKGQTGIPQGEYNKMVKEMRTAGYKDAGMGAALEELHGKKVISGEDFQKALIKGTADLDNQAAGHEFTDMKKFATENWDKMTPAAREKFRIYEDYAQGSRSAGETGIDVASYREMLQEIRSVPNDLGRFNPFRL